MFRNLTRYAEHHLVATSSTVQYEWYTDWLPTDGVDNIRAVLKAKNTSGGQFGWQLAIQYATVRADNPDTPGTLGTQQDSDGEYVTGDLAVGTSMQSKRLFRLGVAYFSAGAAVQGDVALVASWKSVGTILGAQTVNLEVVDSGGIKYMPLTGWVPATFMAKIKAAFILSGLTITSNFRYQLAYQLATTSVQQPDAWATAEASWTTPSTANNERNTGEITVSASSKMWFRLGVAYSMTSGVDQNATAQLDAVLSCR